MTHTTLAERVRFLRNPAGGFTEFNPKTPQLYATYYHLKLHDHPDFEATVSNRSATVEWLQSRADEGFATEESDEPTILDVYHGIRSLYLLDALGDTVAEEYADEGATAREQVRHVIDAPDADTKQRVGRVFRLLRIHDALDVTYDSVAPIETWLVETWGEFARNVSATTLPEMEKLYESLRLLGYDHGEITTVADPTEAITELIFPANLDGHPREMFALRSYHELRKQFAPSRTLSDRVVRELASSQNEDGGFSASGAPISDCKGTYIATKLLLETDNAAAFDGDAVRRFASHHALSGGGFSLNYRRPTNLRNTYLVCRGLDQASESPEEVVRAGNPLPPEQFQNERPSPKELYQLLYVRSLDGADPPEIDTDRFVRQRAMELSDDPTDEGDPLADAHYLTRLEEEFTSTGYRDDVTEAVCDATWQFQNPDGGFGTNGTSTARQTYFGTRTLVRRGGDTPDETVACVRANRNDDGGFGKYHVEVPGSDVVSTYYSVMTLTELGIEIENAERVVSWLENARHPDGGWAHDPADRPGQGPTVQYTVLAERLRSVLDEAQSPVEPGPT